jgi:hypothetical protein
MTARSLPWSKVAPVGFPGRILGADQGRRHPHHRIVRSKHGTLRHGGQVGFGDLASTWPSRNQQGRETQANRHDAKRPHGESGVKSALASKNPARAVKRQTLAPLLGPRPRRTPGDKATESWS